MQDAAIEVAVDDLSHIGPEKAIFFWQNAHHSPAQASRNGLQHTDNTESSVVCEGDRQAMYRA